MAKILKENVSIDFGDKVWSSDEHFDAFPAVFVQVLSGDATFDGTTGGIDMYSNFNKANFDDRNNSCFAITVGDMKLHDANGNRTSTMTPASEGLKGNLVINGGTFFSQPSSSSPAQSDDEREKYGNYRHFLLNLFDSFGKRGDASIVVKGGSFIGFDPADNYAEGNNTNFVATGYKSVEDGEFTYTVKDTNRADNGSLVTVKVYMVVPSFDEREGIEGIL